MDGSTISFLKKAIRFEIHIADLNEKDKQTNRKTHTSRHTSMKKTNANIQIEKH